MKSSPNGQPNPQLSGNLAATLGHCSRVLCFSNFSVSSCLDDVKDVKTTEAANDKDLDSMFDNGDENGDKEELWFGDSSLVVLSGESYVLQRKQIFGDLVMVAVSTSKSMKEGREGGGGGGDDDDDDDDCWLYPGEHMSFSLLHSLSMQSSTSARQAYNKVKQQMMNDDKAILNVETCVGSLVHLLGIDNWFHLIREGLGGLLFLLRYMPMHCKILVPDTADFKRVGRNVYLCSTFLSLCVFFLVLSLYNICIHISTHFF
jgi:hypothetical protein